MSQSLTFSQWQEFARNVRERADRLQRSIHERGWKIAVEAGIGRDMCCVHNCSIAELGSGWGANPGGRERIKAAKRALRFLDDWTVSRLADRIIDRAWKRTIH